MQSIYVEASDEITTVIERLKKAEEKTVALVVPKDAILLQSIVNLKLAKKAAADAGKELTLVTMDKIGRNLATQIGLPVIARLGDEQEVLASTEEPEEQGVSVIDGVKVHRYYDETNKEEPIEVQKEAGAEEVETPEPIEIKEEAAAVPDAEPEEAPIVVRKLLIETPETVKKPETKPPVVELIPPQLGTTIARKSINTEKEVARPKRFKKFLAFIAYLILLVLIASGAVGAFYLPKTVLTVYVKPLAFTQDIPLNAKVGATSSGDTLPAQLITAQTTDTVQANSTGTKDVGTTASGTAQIFNQYSTSPTLPIGTLIVVNGINFATTEQISVPPVTVLPTGTVNGTFTVNITAQNPGDNGNMSDKLGSVPQTNLSARIVSTTGGTSKTVAIVSDTDIANARVQLNKKLQDDVAHLLDYQAKSNANNLFSSSNDQFSVDGFTTTAPSGTETQNFTVGAKDTGKRLIIDRTVAEKIVQTRLQSSHDSSHTLSIDALAIQNLVVDSGQNTATFTVHATGNILPIVPVDTLVSQLTGKNLSDAESLIKFGVKEADRFQVTRTPTWWPVKNFPFSKKYITVRVQHE